MKTVLVTGGTGYIGSHTCITLLESGYKVIVFDSLINSHLEVIQKIKNLFDDKIPYIDKRIHFVQGDIRNKRNIDDLFRKFHNDNNNIDAVIHFAGLKSVRDSVKFPIKYWNVNMLGSLNLLEIMSKYSCRKIIFSSSATLYSQRNILPFKENGDLSPINPYGNTKLAVETLMGDLFNNGFSDWRICNLRYFNPIGAHPSGLIGENPIGRPNNIFPIILNVASKKLEGFQIYGKDWDTHDGTCIRDYIHVMDIAEGHVVSLNYLFNNDPQLISFNLGTGKGTSVLSLINTFEKVNNVRIPYEYVKKRQGDLPVIIADNLKAKKILNWEPKRNIEEMCKDGWKWKKQNINGYQ